MVLGDIKPDYKDVVEALGSQVITICPHIDPPEPLFVTEPNSESGERNEVIEAETGVRVNAATGEVL